MTFSRTTAVRGPIQGAVAVAAFAAMFFFEASLVIVMFSAIALGIALTAVRPGLLHRPGKASAEEDEESYYIRSTSAAMKPISLLWPTMKLAAVVLFLWLLPLPLFYYFAGDFHFWRGLALFFTKTAFVTIGGSYTVIPYVAQVAVLKLHWLSRLQMLDGFALAWALGSVLFVIS
jgi:chromate transporter